MNNLFRMAAAAAVISGSSLTATAQNLPSYMAPDRKSVV